jgi:hypothetical protein
MQPKQSANLAAIARMGFVICVPKSLDPSRQVQAAIRSLLADEAAQRKAKTYAEHLRAWNGSKKAAEILLSEFGPEPADGTLKKTPDSIFATFSGNCSTITFIALFYSNICQTQRVV